MNTYLKDRKYSLDNAQNKQCEAIQLLSHGDQWHSEV